ncbi:MAG: hypothetical protein JWQ71_1239 [Pedosphaera sp.]|nr:hypothetical protein [Pedosphaera sp.]
MNCRISYQKFGTGCKLGVPAFTAFWLGLCLMLGAFVTQAQTPLSNLVFSVGTTIKDSANKDWSYVVLGSPSPQLLAGKRMAVYGKPGFSTNAGSFTLRGNMAQAADAATINNLLNQSLSLGENFASLTTTLNTLLHKTPGVTNLSLPQKVLAAFQAGNSDPSMVQKLSLMTRLYPGLTLCLGQGFAEQISTTTTYEIRELNPASGTVGDVVGRVTIVPGAPIILPAPGAPFQLVTNAPTDHLKIRLRWGTPDSLRRLSLLSFGYNVWRIPRAAAEAAGYPVTPPTIAQLHGDPNFLRANSSPAMVNHDYSTGSGSGAADDPADRVTSFFTDTGRPSGVLAFADGAEFYYFVTARDILGRDGFVSSGGLARACRRLPPQAPSKLKVENNTQILPLGGGAVTNQQRLLISWQQNNDTNDLVSEYWIYRWPNPTMALTNESAPFSNRVGVVTHIANTNVNSYLDNGTNAPTVAGVSTYWYTVRAVSQAACTPLFSPNSGPASGVLRQRDGPVATTGDVVGSCGTPVIAFKQFNLLTNPNGPDVANINMRITVQRRDPGIAWVQISVTNYLNQPINYPAQTFGPLYFSPDGDTVQADYTLPTGGTNFQVDATCVAGTYYGTTSTPAGCHFGTAISTNQIREAFFVAGQLVETALDVNDPLLTALNNGQTSCQNAYNVVGDASGTVGMQFDYASGTPLLIQVYSNGTWSSLGVFSPDTNNIYWVSYPPCVLKPLPPFQGCYVNLPSTGNCDQHIAQAANGGPTSPIRIRFKLAPRTREYRIYRSIDDGPLSLIAQGAAVFDPANPNKQVVRTDDGMPPSAAQLCYFVQVLDEHGNGSPLSPIGCKQVKPAKLPRPTMAEPQAIGTVANPQVSLNWFCPTSGVARFQVKVVRDDQPGSGKSSGFASSNLTAHANFKPTSLFPGLLNNSKYLRFDEAFLTPRTGAGFGPGPQFTIPVNVLASVPYTISVAAVDAQGNVGDSSPAWKFTWQPPIVLPSVPWPARPVPAVKVFDDNLSPSIPAYFRPRVAAVLLKDGNFQIDPLYPVGIRIGNCDTVNNLFSNVRSTNFISYNFVAGDPKNDPHELIFKRQSADPSHRGESLLPIVVYRQQVTNSVFPRVSSNLTQVTPLLERIPYINQFIPRQGTVIIIPDRLLATTFELDPISNANGYFLYLRDQQPVIRGARYQYFVVRFNQKHEVAEVIPAGQVDIPPNL